MTAAPGSVRLRSLSWTPLGRARPVVSDLDLDIGPGERVLLLGASGAGKSTLLHAMIGVLGGALAGELSGTVEVGGRIGLLPQDPHDAIVADRLGRDVAFGPENLGLPRQEIWRRVDAALSAVGLAYDRDRSTSALSGGERQRLALAGVLALRPDVMVLDEPTSMLDPVSAAASRDAVLQVVGDRTLVVVEHRFEPWLEHVDRVIVVRSGAIVHDSDVATFLASDQPDLWMPGSVPPSPADVAAVTVEPVGPSLEPAARDLSVTLTSRGLRDRHASVAVDSLDIDTRAGRRLALMGPSGAGKSTAMLALAGLIRPSSGVVTPELWRWRTRQLAGAAGWVPQNPEHTFVTTTVRDELAGTSSLLGRSVDTDQVLDVLGLTALADMHPFRLSGGEQRRLALGAALAHRPAAVFLDEPTVGQDRGTWAAVTGWLSAAATAGATVVVSTHDADLPVDDVLTLARGRAA